VGEGVAGAVRDDRLVSKWDATRPIACAGGDGAGARMRAPRVSGGVRREWAPAGAAGEEAVVACGGIVLRG